MKRRKRILVRPLILARLPCTRVIFFAGLNESVHNVKRLLQNHHLVCFCIISCLNLVEVDTCNLIRIFVIAPTSDSPTEWATYLRLQLTEPQTTLGWATY